MIFSFKSSRGKPFILLLDDKILDWSKLKKIADEILKLKISAI